MDDFPRIPMCPEALPRQRLSLVVPLPPRPAVVSRKWLPVWRVMLYPTRVSAFASRAPDRSRGSFTPQ